MQQLPVVFLLPVVFVGGGGGGSSAMQLLSSRSRAQMHGFTLPSLCPRSRRPPVPPEVRFTLSPHHPLTPRPVPPSRNFSHPWLNTPSPPCPVRESSDAGPYLSHITRSPHHSSLPPPFDHTYHTRVPPLSGH